MHDEDAPDTGTTDDQVATVEGIIDALCRPDEPVPTWHLARYILMALIPPGARISSPEREAAIRRALGDMENASNGEEEALYYTSVRHDDLALILDTP